jgi:protein-disulfide isomerase
MHQQTPTIAAAFWGLLFFMLLSLPGVVQVRAASEPLAVVDGVVITAEEVEKSIGAPLMKLQEQLYNMKRQKVEALINERLLAREAAKRAISVQALLDAEVTAKVGLVTEQEIESYYQANRARLKGEETTVREQIRAQLQNQKLAAQRQAFLQSLRSQAKVVVHLKPPPVFRVLVSASGAPFKGPEKAPVTIVKFEDFHCPFCKQIQPTFTELVSRYGDRLKVVHKDFPIDQLHPGARKGHEAARCANEQGKFWAYHDKLYENAPKADPDQLMAYAKDVGLNLPTFDKCFGSEKYKAAVQKDVEEGTRAGVTGTPAFFVNGRMISGAQPLESFVRVIDDELELAR